MSTAEQTIRTCAKLYHYRDTMRSFWGVRYSAKMVEYRSFIERSSAATGLPTLHTTMNLVKKLQARSEDTGMVEALLFAACVEMIEPSKGE